MLGLKTHPCFTPTIKFNKEKINRQQINETSIAYTAAHKFKIARHLNAGKKACSILGHLIPLGSIHGNTSHDLPSHLLLLLTDLTKSR